MKLILASLYILISNVEPGCIIIISIISSLSAKGIFISKKFRAKFGLLSFNVEMTFRDSTTNCGLTGISSSIFYRKKATMGNNEMAIVY